jgi:hypothetical protein
MANWGDEDDKTDRNSNHRGRAKIHELQAGLHKELLACKDHKEFWEFVRKRTDPRPKRAKVSLQDLSDDFEARLNYPAVAPVSFNADQQAFNKQMADEPRQPPADTSPHQLYTRDITTRYAIASLRLFPSFACHTALLMQIYPTESTKIPIRAKLQCYLYRPWCD